MTNQEPSIQIAAAVLMGGSSTRMGSPKQHVDLGGTAMGQRVIELARDCCDCVVVSGPGDAMPDVEHIPDLAHHTGLGPLAGIEAILTSGRAARWLVLPCDMPSLKTATARQLAGSAATIAALADPANPSTPLQLPLALDVSMLQSISDFLDSGRRSVGGWLRTVNVESLPSPPMREIRNVNSPEDLVS
jgi:molybdopterin-guanine dinucleotide biosynthesis protein A